MLRFAREGLAAGLLAAQVFLDVNGIALDDASVAFYDLTMGISEERLDKVALA